MDARILRRRNLAYYGRVAGATVALSFTLIALTLYLDVGGSEFEAFAMLFALFGVTLVLATANAVWPVGAVWNLLVVAGLLAGLVFTAGRIPEWPFFVLFGVQAAALAALGRWRLGRQIAALPASVAAGLSPAIDPGSFRDGQRPERGRMLLFAGGCWVIVAASVTVVALVEEFSLEDLTSPFAYVGAALGLLLWIAVPGLVLIRRGRRHLSPCYDDALSAPGVQLADRGPILYLRAFSSDGRRAAFPVESGWSLLDRTARRVLGLVLRLKLSYEEVLSHRLREVGPLIGIGRPHGALPELGAIREYVEDDGWQDRVRVLVRGSQLVLIQMGTSAGVLWEVARVVAEVDPRKLILAVPHLTRSLDAGLRFAAAVAGTAAITTLALRVAGASFGTAAGIAVTVAAVVTLIDGALTAVRRSRERKTLYATFRRESEGIFPHALPEDIGASHFIRFDDEWKPVPVPHPRPRFLPWSGPSRPVRGREALEGSLEWLTTVFQYPPLRYRLLEVFYALIWLVLLTAAVGGFWPSHSSGRSVPEGVGVESVTERMARPPPPYDDHGEYMFHPGMLRDRLRPRQALWQVSRWPHSRQARIGRLA